MINKRKLFFFFTAPPQQVFRIFIQQVFILNRIFAKRI